MVSGHASRAHERAAFETAAIPRRTVLTAGTALIAGAASAFTACLELPRSPLRSAAVDLSSLARRYADLVLDLAKHQPSLVDDWRSADPGRAGSRIPAPSLRAMAGALRAEAERNLPDIASPAPQSETSADARLERARARYLLGQIRAADVVAGRLIGEGQRFAEEARIAFGHEAPARDAAALDAIRRELSERLVEGRGSLAERHAAYRKALAVPRDRLEQVFQSAVDWCRDATRATLPLPAGETMTTRTADERGWAAFSRPSGPASSELWIARDGGSDAAQVLQLAAHEGTPGHHAQHVLATARLVDGAHWTERTFTPAFGPHRLFAEGAAEAGAELLLPLEVRERVLAERLLPAAGQRPSLAASLVRIERLVAALDLEVAYVAAEYLDGAMPSADAADRLKHDALLLDPGGMVGFIEKQRSKVLAYPLGRRLVTAALGAGDTASRWTRFAAITTTLTLPAPGE